MPLYNCRKFMQEYVEPTPPTPTREYTITFTIGKDGAGSYISAKASNSSANMWFYRLPGGASTYNYTYYAPANNTNSYKCVVEKGDPYGYIVLHIYSIKTGQKLANMNDAGSGTFARTHTVNYPYGT